MRWAAASYESKYLLHAVKNERNEKEISDYR